MICSNFLFQENTPKMRSNARKIVSVLVLILLCQYSCKKAIQTAQEDFVVNLITSNLWTVTLYSENGTNQTALFAGYDFKFNKDLTVWGQLAGQPDAAGTWRGDASAMTITSAFPNGPAPLQKLTGIWNITRTTLSSVKSTRTENGVTYLLDLQKK